MDIILNFVKALDKSDCSILGDVMYKFKLLFLGFWIYFYSVLIYSLNKFIVLLIDRKKSLSSYSIVRSAKLRERIIYKTEKVKNKYADLIIKEIRKRGYYN